LPPGELKYFARKSTSKKYFKDFRKVKLFTIPGINLILYAINP
jgi:hypothetical protein